MDLLQKFQKNWGGELTKEQYDIYIENRNHNPHKIDYLYRCLYTGAGEEYQLEGQFNCSIKELKELYPGVHHTQITLLKALFISLSLFCTKDIFFSSARTLLPVATSSVTFNHF